MRSDIIPLPSLDCEFVESLPAFAEPQQFYSGDNVGKHTLKRLAEIISASAAGVRLNNHGPIEKSNRFLSRSKPSLKIA